VITRLSVSVAMVLFVAASTAEAGSQLFEASWTVKAFGNERTGGTGSSAYYSAFGIPQGIQCNPIQPRCPFESTPTDGAGNFAPLGGSQMTGLFCAPWANWRGLGTTARPAKGQTPSTGGKWHRQIPPVYKNLAFFTTGGAPNATFCTATSMGATPGGKGRVQAGMPITGKALATTTGTGKGAFQFPAAAAQGAQGIRGTRVGEFAALYPYLYTYTYATLRNDAGMFGPGKGPGDAYLKLPRAGGAVTAHIEIKQGPNKFGGTMRMLGALTTKVCYYAAGGCSLNYQDWRYDAIGAAAYTSNGIVTKGYQAPNYTPCGYICGPYDRPYHRIVGSRFPWTTGSVTVTAVGRGPHKTVHYAKGYDNRTPTSGMGTIQLVSPTLTRWFTPRVYYETTGGIAILKLKFVPEPHAWLMLAAGISCLAVSLRWRG